MSRKYKKKVSKNFVICAHLIGGRRLRDIGQSYNTVLMWLAAVRPMT